MTLPQRRGREPGTRPRVVLDPRMMSTKQMGAAMMAMPKASKKKQG